MRDGRVHRRCHHRGRLDRSWRGRSIRAVGPHWTSVTRPAQWSPSYVLRWRRSRSTVHIRLVRPGAWVPLRRLILLNRLIRRRRAVVLHRHRGSTGSWTGSRGAGVRVWRLGVTVSASIRICRCRNRLERLRRRNEGWLTRRRCLRWRDRLHPLRVESYHQRSIFHHSVSWSD